MADTVFTNGVTLTDSDWFNDTNRIVYTILADSANAAAARTALAAAASGANADITSLTGLTTPLSVAQGGQGVDTLAAKGILFGNGTSAVGVTAVGTATHVLTSNGAGVDPTFQAPVAGATITLGTPVTASGTSISFTSIPANTKQIIISFSGLSTNGSSNLLIQIGDSGGIENTGYASGATYLQSSSAVTLVSSTGGFIFTGAFAAGEVVNGSMILSLLSASTNGWAVQGSNVDLASTENMNVNCGTKALSATLDRLQFIAANGTDTFDAGTVNIQYIV